MLGVTFMILDVSSFSASVPVTSGVSVTTASVLALCWPGSVGGIADMVTDSVPSVVGCTLVSLGTSEELPGSVVGWVLVPCDTLTLPNGGVVGPDVVDDRVDVVTGLVNVGGCWNTGMDMSAYRRATCCTEEAFPYTKLYTLSMGVLFPWVSRTTPPR